MLHAGYVRLVLTAVLGAGTPAALAQSVDPSNPFPPPPPAQPGVAPKPNPTGPQPKILFENAKHDFGNILSDKTVTHKFSFTNKGEGTLIITSATGSCGCTVPALEKTEYKPGESGEISVTFNPHGREGNVAQRVTVVSNDPEHPSTVLDINANVEPLVWSEPKLASFGKIAKGESKTLTIEVTGRTEDFRVLKAEFNQPPTNIPGVIATPMKVKINDPISGERNGQKVRTVKVDVIVPEGTSIGRLQQQLTIETSDSRIAPIVIPALGEVVGDLDVAPPRMSLGVVARNQPFKGEMTITNRKGTPFVIKGIEQLAVPDNSPAAGVALTFEATPNAQKTVYTVKVSGAAPDRNVRMLLDFTIKTDVPQEESLRGSAYLVVR